MMAENVRRGVNRHVQLRREGDVKTLPPAPKKIAVPRPRSCVWLLLKEGEKLTEEERIVRQAVLDASPVVGQGLKLDESYREAIGSRIEEKLATWMVAAAESQIPEFENFVMALRRDEAAVRAAASSEWSNGQTEGQVNRLKVLKRQMYGRANFDGCGSFRECFKSPEGGERSVDWCASARSNRETRRLRASSDFDEYWDFYLQQEYKRNHEARYENGDVPKPLPASNSGPKGFRLRLVK